MKPFPLVLFALALSCSGEPEAPQRVAPPPEPATAGEEPSVPSAPPADPVQERRPPVSAPAEPALHSFTGQGTHQGAGLWCAFYPLGWSDDGRFAWAAERRANDMALEYGAVWSVMHVGSVVNQESVGFSAQDFPEDAQLAWAWERQRDRVEALLSEQTILAGGTELLPLPSVTPMGTLSARWELGPLEDFDRPASLLIRWDDGPEQEILATRWSDLAPEPQPPSLILAPSGEHAVLVIPVVEGEPVEALVGVEYRVHGLALR
jgi:hypothetical protein